jgi:hypothetical protein
MERCETTALEFVSSPAMDAAEREVAESSKMSPDTI